MEVYVKKFFDLYIISFLVPIAILSHTLILPVSQL